MVRQVLGDDIELVHASNADEALLMIAQFTEQDRPDLFLVDLRLPDNGGFSYCRRPAPTRRSPACRCS